MMIPFSDSSPDFPNKPPFSPNVLREAMDKRLFRLSLFFFFFASLVTAGLYFYALSYTQPVVDDYCNFNLSRCTSTAGFIKHYMPLQPGRLFLFATLSRFQGDFWCIRAPGIGILFMWTVLFFTLWLFLSAVAFCGETSRWGKGMAFSMGIVSIYWATDPHPGELMFWLSATITYLSSLTAVLLTSLFCAWYAASPPTASRRRLLWIALPVGFVLLTSVEIITFFFLGFAALLCVACRIKRSPQWRFWLGMTGLATLAILFVVLNPGTSSRLRVSESESLASDILARLTSPVGIKLFLRDGLPSVWKWTFSAPVLLVCALLSLLPREKDNLWPQWFAPVGILLLIGMVLTGMLVLCVTLNGINFRVWSALQIIFYIAIVTIWRRAGWHVKTATSTTRRAAALILVLMGIFALFSDNNRAILNDIRQGRFERFGQERRHRIQILREAALRGEKHAIIPFYTDRPSCFYGFLDANQNPETRTNQEMAKYYGLESVTVAPREHLPR
jgi:hypothetical protein